MTKKLSQRESSGWLQGEDVDKNSGEIKTLKIES